MTCKPSSIFGVPLVVLLCLLSIANAFHWPRPLLTIKHPMRKLTDQCAIHSANSALMDRRNDNSSAKLRPSNSRPYPPRKQPVKAHQPPAKPKRLPENRMKPRVDRPVRGEDRVSMDKLYVGQRLKGRIINVLDYGMFVDVGTMKDGLVHIKDISNDHFVKNVNGKYVAGDDVTVYVKFVVPEQKKFGLQMYPVDAKLEQDAMAFQNKTLLQFEELQQGQAVLGQVVRSSSFGVYVDIGVPGITAFLHRRKMKSNRRMRHFEPVAVCPMGSIQQCYIHEIDTDYRRIAVTTYEPTLWDARILPPSGLKPTWEDDGMHIYEPGFDGGEVPAQRDPLKRVMALEKLSRQTSPSRQNSDSGDRDEENAEFDVFDEDTEDSSEYDHPTSQVISKHGDAFDTHGESLSAAEIRRLAPQYANSLLIDDVDDSLVENTDTTENTEYTSDNNSSGSGISNKNDKNIKNKKKYPSRYDLAEDLTTAELFDSIRHRARPYIILSDLKKWNYIKALVHQEMLTVTMLTSLFLQAGTTAGKMNALQLDNFLELLAVRLNLHDDNKDYSEFDFPDNAIKASDLSQEYQSFADFSYNTTKEKAGIEEDEEEFELPAALAGTEVYKTSSSGTSGSSSSAVDKGRDIIGASKDVATSQYSKRSSLFQQRAMLRGRDRTRGNTDTTAATINATIDTPSSILTTTHINTTTSPIIGDTTATAAVTPDTATDTSTAIVPKKRGRKPKSITTATLNTDSTYAMRVPTTTAASDHKANATHASLANIDGVTSSGDSIDAKGTKEEKEANEEVAEEVAEEFAHPDYGESGLSTEELTQKVFEHLANGKKHITSKDVRNWDLVHVLLAEGVLTDESLEEKISEYKTRFTNRKGLNLEAFNDFADELALLYARSLSEQTDWTEGGEQVNTNTITDISVENALDIGDNEQKRSVTNEENEEREADEEEEEGEVVELDTVGDFERMSHGRGFITLQDLKQWSFLQQGSMELTDAEWASVLSECKIPNTDSISAIQFEAIVDVVLSKLEWSEEETGGGEGCVEGCEDSTHVH